MKTEVIKTARLEIKPYTESDKAGITELLTNDIIKKTFMIPDFDSDEKLMLAVERLAELSYSTERLERGIFANGCLIGFVNDVGIDGDEIEIGYAINPAYHNRGYATEMLGAVIEMLFADGFKTVTAGAFVENLASILVMQKCGMTKIEKEEDIPYKEAVHHCVYYAVKNSAEI